jgi:ribulose 1,5-bisphosphate synthetase/thiazole synthase
MADKFQFRSAPRGSSWRDAKNPRTYPALRTNIEADVAIIGGGMAGVTLAYELAEAGMDAVLLQDKTLAEGATRDTTAFLMQDIDT